VTTDPARGLVLIVEDERAISDLLRLYVTREGFGVHVATDGLSALAAARTLHPVAIILDVGLPVMDGTEVCRILRAEGNWVPILFCTARDDEVDRVLGLELGADDYITKPYRMRELVARMRAVLRRAPIDKAGELTEGALVVGDVQLDPEQHVVVIRGESASLPLKEFELLHILLANAGRVLPRETLIDRVWGSDYVGDTKTLDVHIKRLRAKIEDDPGTPQKIVTIRGLGYKYERPKS